MHEEEDFDDRDLADLENEGSYLSERDENESMRHIPTTEDEADAWEDGLFF